MLLDEGTRNKIEITNTVPTKDLLKEVNIELLHTDFGGLAEGKFSDNLGPWKKYLDKCNHNNTLNIPETD